MSDNIEENEVRFTMRMEANLYNELKEHAKKNRRSLAKELENIVDAYLHKENIMSIPEPIAIQFGNYIEEWLRKHSNENK